MSFPKDIGIRALIACARCCCICHKFCGRKIELHHIEQKADGGKDTFENCIPLCFDCHADMGKSDPLHPKGRQYSKIELKSHRDRWYSKIENSQVIKSIDFIYEEDKVLFHDICNIFSDSIREWLSETNLAGSHPAKVFEPLDELLYNCNNPFKEFLNIELEKLKGNLLNTLNKFLQYRALNTFNDNIAGEKVVVTKYWLLNNRGAIHGTSIPNGMSREEGLYFYLVQANKLNDLSTDAWNCYCEFVRQGRRILSA